MEQAIELMVGIVFLALSVSFLTHAKTWAVWLHKIQHKGRYFSLIMGSINVLIGGLIISFHWIWEGLPMITTIIGALVLFKGIVYLFFPAWLHFKLSLFSQHYKPLIRASGFVLLITASVVLYTWWVEAGKQGINEFCSYFV